MASHSIGWEQRKSAAMSHNHFNRNQPSLAPWAHKKRKLSIQDNTLIGSFPRLMVSTREKALCSKPGGSKNEFLMAFQCNSTGVREAGFTKVKW